MAKKRIGELLLEQGAITSAQLDAGLLAQKQTRRRLGATLVDQGAISEAQLAAALSQALAMPAVDLARVNPDWAAIHMLRPRFCEAHELFPYALESHAGGRKSLLVAMSDPLNGPALQEIEFTTGLAVAPRVATHTQVRQAILRYYHKVNVGQLSPAALAQKGGTVRVVAPAHLREPDEPAIVMGHELPGPAPARGAPAVQSTAASKKSAVNRDLEFLFGGQPDDETTKLARKFWALMRIMARKGLVSADEFAKELEEEES